MLADIENPLGVSKRLTEGLQHVFIASALAFLHQPRTHPPNQWVKPEDRLDKHVERRREVVATANVTQLVGQDGFQLRRRETFLETRGHEQYRTPESDDARLQQVG